MGLEEKFDFRKFTQRIYIAKSSEYIYNMWTTKEHIEQWFVKNARYHTSDGRLRDNTENIRSEDEYEWEWIDSAKLIGKIISADEKKNLRFTFGRDVTVSVNLTTSFERTLVELTQEQNMEDYEMKFDNYMACFPGWSFFLINLKSVCEGGLDLREMKPDVDFLVNI